MNVYIYIYIAVSKGIFSRRTFLYNLRLLFQNAEEVARKCSVKIDGLNILQISQENTSIGASLSLRRSHLGDLQLYLNKYSDTGVFLWILLKPILWNICERLLPEKGNIMSTTRSGACRKFDFFYVKKS